MHPTQNTEHIKIVNIYKRETGINTISLVNDYWLLSIDYRLLFTGYRCFYRVYT